MGAVEDDSGHTFVGYHIHAITLGASSDSIFLSLKYFWLFRTGEPRQVTGFSFSQ